jgi:signal transduction histidine kinase
MQEDRLLRGITVQHAEASLNRRMDVLEAAALHAAIDVMLQRSVIAMVEKQKIQLRTAAETELKFLSFLSHDMNNNLNGVLLTLQVFAIDLQRAGGFAEAEQSLEAAQQAIHDTVSGMRQMLDHERLRQSSKNSRFQPVDLHALASKIMTVFSSVAAAKTVGLNNLIKPGSVVESNSELLSLVLQNLVGNGVKYSTAGSVRIGLDCSDNSHSPVIWVSDDGHGIAVDRISHIFEVFSRGEIHGEHGRDWAWQSPHRRRPCSARGSAFNQRLV